MTIEDPEGDLAWQELRHEAERDKAGEELEDVLTFLRRHERDQLLGIQVPPLADLIAALERGEHR